MLKRKLLGIVTLIIPLTIVLLIILSLTSTKARANSPESMHLRGAMLVDNQNESVKGQHTLTITNITITPKPIVGQEASLRVEITSSVDEPEVVFSIQKSDGIEIEDDTLISYGSLVANQPFVYEIPILIREIGDWTLVVTVASTNAAFDSEQLHIISTQNMARVIPRYAYRTIQSKEKWPGNPAELVPFEIPNPPRKDSALNTSTALLPPTVTIQGNLTYGFEYVDCPSLVAANPSSFPGWCPGTTPGTTVLTDTAELRNVQIRLYDRDTTGDDHHYLDTIVTDDNGFYSIVVDNIDPNGDGTGIDPLLYILPTGSENSRKVEIFDPIGTLYFETASAPDNDLVDGTVYVFDYQVPHVFDQADIGQVMYIFDLIANEANDYLGNETNWDNSRVVKVHYPQGCFFGIQDNSCFLGSADGISIVDLDGIWPDVILHEYGHFVLGGYLGDLAVVHACALVGYEHSVLTPTLSSCAYSEGWASFFQMAVQNDPDLKGWPMEEPPRSSNNILPINPGDDPASWEGVVTATLWDIFDSAGTESSGFVDNLADGFDGSSDNGIWQLTTQEANLPNTIQEFYDLWTQKRSGVPDDLTALCEILEEHQFLFYQLDLSVTPAVWGSIQKDPLIHCPNGTFLQDTTVGLTAIAGGGFSFSQWSGDASGSSLFYDVDMNADRDITAEFHQDPTFATKVWMFEYVGADGVVTVDPATGTQLTSANIGFSTVTMNAVAPSNANIGYYLTGSSGGEHHLYKTTDGGVTFQDTNLDFTDAYAVKDVFVAHNDPNKVWVVTNESGTGVGCNNHRVQIHYSDDGGQSWSYTHLNAGNNLCSVSMLRGEVSPQNEQLLFVGGRGEGPYSNNSGVIYKSLDGGSSWEQDYTHDSQDSPVNTFSSISTIVTPQQGSDAGHVWYAAIIGGIGGDSQLMHGILRKNSLNADWVYKAIENCTGCFSSNQIVKVADLAVDTGDSNLVLALVAGEGLYRSTDGGDSWAQVFGNISSLGFGWGLEADSINTNHFWIVGRDIGDNLGRGLFHSIDGGQTWTRKFTGSVSLNTSIWETPSLAISPLEMAVNDQTSTLEGIGIEIGVLLNDLYNTILEIIGVSQPSNGSTTINPGNPFSLNPSLPTITYTPDPGFTGVDSFTYTVQDDNNRLSTATVTVMVGDSSTPHVTVSIEESGANNLRLSWVHETQNSTYHVWHSSTSPYFTSGDSGSVELVALNAPASEYIHNNALADNVNGYYVIVAENGLGTYISNRIGEFNFGIISGTP